MATLLVVFPTSQDTDHLLSAWVTEATARYEDVAVVRALIRLCFRLRLLQCCRLQVERILLRASVPFIEWKLQLVIVFHHLSPLNNLY